VERLFPAPKNRKRPQFRKEYSLKREGVFSGAVRGKKRVRRKPDEAFHPHVITRRWKGFSEFMWWSCFTYDEKGPFHVWEEETKEEKEACKKDLASRNALRYDDDKINWEIENGMIRLRATTMPGKKPQFKDDENTRAYCYGAGTLRLQHTWPCQELTVMLWLLSQYSSQHGDVYTYILAFVEPSSTSIMSNRHRPVCPYSCPLLPLFQLPSARS
jgi:hypothetical protein